MIAGLEGAKIAPRKQVLFTSSTDLYTPKLSLSGPFPLQKGCPGKLLAKAKRGQTTARKCRFSHGLSFTHTTT